MERIKQYYRIMGKIYIAQLVVFFYFLVIFFLAHIRAGIAILTIPCFLIPFFFVYPLRNILVDHVSRLHVYLNGSFIAVCLLFYFGRGRIPQTIGIAMLYCLIIGTLFAISFWAYSDPRVEREE
ncbi:MAG: hypothetical protein R3C11_14695 [Planctomycetaceae bacterium]